MGLFSFISSAGAKLFGGKKPSEIPNLGGIVKNHVKSVGLDVDHMHFWMEGDTLVAAGWVDNKAMKEKVVLAVGNVEGVDTVEDRIVVGAPPQFKAEPAKPAPVAAAPVVAAKAVVAAEAMPAEMVVPSKEEAAKHEWDSKTHVVQKGDTLSKIAKAVYGDAMKYPAIFEANKPMLKDPDLIYPGQVLRIPKLDDKKK